MIGIRAPDFHILTNAQGFHLFGTALCTQTARAKHFIEFVVKMPLQ